MGLINDNQPNAPSQLPNQLDRLLSGRVRLRQPRDEHAVGHLFRTKLMASPPAMKRDWSAAERLPRAAELACRLLAKLFRMCQPHRKHRLFVIEHSGDHVHCGAGLSSSGRHVEEHAVGLLAERCQDSGGREPLMRKEWMCGLD